MRKEKAEAPGEKKPRERYVIPDNWDRFEPRYGERRPDQTDAQWEAHRRSARYYAFQLAAWMNFSRNVVNHFGWYGGCSIAACKRHRRCTGRRAQDDWSVFPGPWMPPCVPYEEVETVRALIREEIEIIQRDHAAKSA